MNNSTVVDKIKYDKELELVRNIATAVQTYGGTSYFVGGFVRDEIMGVPCKDMDIEVHGISALELESVLDTFGERIEIGKSFGIYNLKGYDVDIAMPRRETATGRGHRDFKIDVDPFIGEKNAAKRRDFTINALMKNVLTGEIVDHYDGIGDLKKGVLRHVCKSSFAEDPLRVLRAAQFAARFRFKIAPETTELCSTMDLSQLSSERVFNELCKALLKADRPSLFFEQLKNMKQLDYWFTETERLIGIAQNPKYHPEGDVWTHTMMVVDDVAKYRKSAKNPIGLMLSALVHDFGKIVTTETINGVIHAYNHETEGLPIVRDFMHRLTNETVLIKYVLNMTKLHMKPNTTAAHNSSVKATNKMFDESVEPLDLIFLALGDDCGKKISENFNSSERFLFERLEIFYEYMSRPYVSGKDLINAGVLPGIEFKTLLDYAHKLRLAGISKDDALKQTLAYKNSVKTK